MAKLHLFISLFILFALLKNNVDGTRITINQNGYSDVLVAVSPDVPKTDAVTIIANIKSMITKASRVLFQATEKRAYYKDVRILIPETWDNIIPDAPVTWETFDTSDVRIQPPNSAYGDEPYTVQSGGCGTTGEYIHFTPGYITVLPQTYGPCEKVFVQEWSQFRYGVFDEYGEGLDKWYMPRGQTNKILPSVCSDIEPQFSTSGQCAINPITGVYDQNCDYTLDPNFNPKSSLVSNLLTINSVIDFCHDKNGPYTTIHVSDAPTIHNTLCKAQSIWKVITSNPDFINNNNPPATEDVQLDPQFTIIRSEKGNRFVMVNDISGSMNDFDRITKLYETALRFVQYQISDGSKLGLVEFSTSSAITSQLVLIDGQAARDALSAKLPKVAVGNTCIGCGLQSGLDVLRPSGNGGIIILLTDGLENVRPYIYEVLPAILAAGVRVVTVAFGNEAEDLLEDLATQTGGTSFSVPDTYSIRGLNDAFNGALVYEAAVPYDQIVVLQFEEEYTKVTERIQRSIFVDDTIGRNLQVRIDYTQSAYLQDFLLVSPKNVLYGYSFLKFNAATKTAFFDLPLADVGEWKLSISVPASNLVDAIAVYVTSQSRTTTTVPITAECYIPDGSTVPNAATTPPRIVAKIVQGSSPVIGANITAFIETPSGTREQLQLLDNGVAADTTTEDGIYSRFYTSAITEGRYNVYCEVANGATTYIQRGNHRNLNTLWKMTGDFSRVSNAGSFKVVTPLPRTGTYAPNRVLNLRATIDDKDKKTFKLQFTAPGGNLDNGLATRYEIKYSPNHEDLFEENFVTGGGILITESMNAGSNPLNPAPVGSLQTFTVFLSDAEPERTYFFALRAFNSANQFSSPSNLASIRLPAVGPTCPPVWMS